MARIWVDLSELRRMARECQETGAQLRAVGDRCHMALSVHDWEVAHRVHIEGLVGHLVSQANYLARQIYEMGLFLEAKAEAYRAADQEGARRIGEAAATIMVAASGTVDPSRMPSGAFGLTPPPPGIPGKEPSASSGPVPAPRAWEVDNGRLDSIFDRDGVPDLSRIPASEAPPSLAPAGFPLFKQNDPAWADLRLHNANWAKYGCTLTSMAMTVQHFRPDVTVDRDFMANLRDAATNAEGNAVWGDADRYLRERYRLRLEYSDAGVPMGDVMTHAAAQLTGPVPVPTILGLDPSNGKPMHWVVISGFTGDPVSPRPEDFQISDPGGDRSTLADLLGEWGRPVTASRYVNIRPLDE